MDDLELLSQLSAALKMEEMPTQTLISQAVGVDQPFVSRAMRGELKRVTPRVRRLCDYATKKADEIERSRALRARQPVPLPPLALEVLSDCKSYLEQGCDAALLRDQLTVLRRAQGIAGR